MTEPLEKTKTVGAENTFTDAFQLDEGEVAAISIICDGSWSGTIVVQRRFGSQSTWANVEPVTGTPGFTASAQIDYEAACSQDIRVGCPTGSYSAGSAAVVIRVGK